MAREQSTRPYGVPSDPSSDSDDGRDPVTGLTPAQEHAMRRSAPLSPGQFAELRRLAERGVNPLPRL